MAAKRKRVGIAFGAALRGARRNKQVTQERLAELADYVPHYIANIEAGRQQPSVTAIVAFEAALGLEPGELIKRTREALGKARPRKAPTS